MSSPDWLCHFICPGQSPINRGIPPLPSTFLRFSFFDIPRLKPCLGISSRPQPSFVLEPGISSSLVF